MNNCIEFYILIHNNVFCAEYQIKTIRAFCKDNYKIIILDSNCGEYPEISEKLRVLCNTEGIELLNIPNEYQMKNYWISDILGTKLNYIYNEIIKIRQPTYFAFLDQDMFMFRPFKIIDFLDQYGMWGDVDEYYNAKSPTLYKKDMIQGPWYLHPWLSFYKYDFVKDKTLDFRPISGISDTGGQNWETFISKEPNLVKSNYWFRDNIHMTFPWKEVSSAGPHPYEDHYFMLNDKQTYGQIQINNGFIHMLNSPNDLLHPKVCYVKGFLDSVLLNNK